MKSELRSKALASPILSVSPSSIKVGRNNSVVHMANEEKKANPF